MGKIHNVGFVSICKRHKIQSTADSQVSRLTHPEEYRIYDPLLLVMLEESP